MIMQTQLIPQYANIPLHPHLAWQFHFIHILYYHYPFREGGRTQIARHNLDVLKEVVLLNVGKHLFFTAPYLQYFILVGLLILYRISFILRKNPGGRSILSIAFLKNLRKWKK